MRCPLPHPWGQGFPRKLPRHDAPLARFPRDMRARPTPWYRRVMALAEPAGDRTQQDVAPTLGVSKTTDAAPALDRGSCLYHYTSAAGLVGILRQRALWATDTAFLNDWQEIVYAAEPLVADMEALLEKVSQDDALNNPYQRTRSTIIQSALNAIKRFTRMNINMSAPNPSQHIDAATFVACFCEQHDQLGQWRGYGQSGYSIGFRKTGLENIIAPYKSAQLRKVLYGTEGRTTTCNEIIDHFETHNLTAHPGVAGYYGALMYCMPRLAAVKHGAFEQEVEWRLILPYDGLSGHRPVEVRTSPRLIPYVEMPFDPSSIAEIVIGPGGDFHSERAVRAALRANEYDPDKVQITHSEAPFRG
jgi:hypothetical protein